MITGVQTTPVVLPTDWVMDFFRPVVNEEPTSWAARIEAMRWEGILHSEAERLMRLSLSVDWPLSIVLDSRGWVVQGSDVVIAAYMKGARRVSCSFLVEEHS